MNQHKKSMRLLVLGDESVGKTSLIMSFMSQVPTQTLQKTLKKVILPPQLCIYSKDIFTQIIDSSSQSNIAQQMSQCDIILLVYDISQPLSISRLQTHWFPIINSFNPKIPIILVGNKYDKKELKINDQNQYVNVRTILKNNGKKYRQIQMGFQCSAYYDRNIKKVLNCSQRAVLYPLAPLYDLNTKQLTPKFQQALTRIFRILDKDMDGKITDAQLRSLQERVFQTDLNGEDIKAIKQIILRQLQEYHQDYIKLNGFFALQKKCIQMLKIQICWSILRHFNYNNNLQIVPSSQAFILSQQSGQTLQLSANCVSFLQQMYTFSSSNSEELPLLQYLFRCAPKIPLQQFTHQTMTLQKFLITWNLFTFIDYKQCYMALLYLGWDQGLQGTFKKIRAKKTLNDLLKLKDRKFFAILFVQPSNNQYSGCFNMLFRNAVDFRGQQYYLKRQTYLYNQENKQSKVLILLKINQKHLKSFFEGSSLKNRLDIVLLFDSQQNNEQFYQYPKKNSLELFQEIQTLLAGHTMVRKLSIGQCQKVLKISTLPTINLQQFPVSYKDENWKGLFSEIIKTFEKLQLGYSKQKLDKLKKETENMNKLFTGAGIVGAALLGCILLKKNPLNLIQSLKS